ncbi:MAG: YdbL family protein [Oceanococcus sp.]
MNMLRWSALIPLSVVTIACVTINVYFPAAVADRVADQFVQDVYGPSKPSAATPAPANEPQSSWNGAIKLMTAAVNFVLPVAHAQADFDANTPAIQRIKASLQNRHKDLEAYYISGAVGMTNNGEVVVRELGAVSLPLRNALRKLVADENAERAALYREIATANNHPEWEPEIRSAFAERWISNARSGWSYEAKDGSWKTK